MFDPIIDSFSSSRSSHSSAGLDNNYVSNWLTFDAVQTKFPLSGSTLIGNTSAVTNLQSLYVDSSSTFAPEKAFKSIDLLTAGWKSFDLPAQSSTVLAAQKAGTLGADGKLSADGIFAKTFGDATKAGASYFDPQSWTKDLKLVAGNKNAYTLQAASDDGKKTLTVTEVATGKDPYGASGTGANGAVKETVVFTGSDNDKLVTVYASNAVNVVDASAIAGSSVDALTTSSATTYVNANKGIASVEKQNTVHKYNDVNGVQASADSLEYGYNYKDKGLTIVETVKNASKAVNYAKLDKATAVENSGANYYYDNSNPANAVKVQYNQTQSDVYNKTTATTFKDVVTTNLAQYKVSDNTNLDGFKLEAKGVITATTTDTAATAYTYVNPVLSISNNAYALTVKSFATAANGLNYANGGSFASNAGLGVVANTTAAKGVVYANPALKIDARSAVTSITGTINNDEIKVIIPVDKTTGLNASNTADKGTMAGGVVNGGAGNDTIIGGALNDALTGGAGADVLTGGAGVDTFNIDENDTITDLTGVDVVAMTAGYTTVATEKALAATAQKPVVTLTFSGDQAVALDLSALLVTQSLNDDTFVAKDKDGNEIATTRVAAANVIGSDKNDTFTGGDGDDTVSGGKGDDTINTKNGNDSIVGGDGADNLDGSAGNDTISGDAGNDTLIGGKGADVIDGGAGSDTYQPAAISLTAGTAADFEGVGKGTVTGFVINLGADLSREAIAATTVQNISNADGFTKVAANTAAYLFDTAAATNSIVQDTLKNIENVTGSRLNDYIVGSSAANVITGNQGADTMAGGDGADVFVFPVDNAAKLKSETGGASNDVITDFGIGADKIQLTVTFSNAAGGLGVSTAYSAATTTGLLAADFVSKATASVLAANAANGGRFIFDTTTKTLSFDAKGDTAMNAAGSVLNAAGAVPAAGAANTAADDFVVLQLTGASTTLTAADFNFA